MEHGSALLHLFLLSYLLPQFSVQEHWFIRKRVNF